VSPPLTLILHRARFAVCQLPADAPLPAADRLGELWSVTRTPDELSLVVEASAVDPAWRTVEAGWRCLQVEGPLDFSLVGILAALAGALAEAGVSIFALSTYNTDYLLVRDADVRRAVRALRGQGHRVRTPDESDAQS